MSATHGSLQLTGSDASWNSDSNMSSRYVCYDNCIRADGLCCKLSAIVRGAASLGLSRTEVISILQSWGFQIASDGAYVVRGIALKEPEYV